MGIKRLKKVFVITGDKDDGKTRCVKELARRFLEMHYTYNDLMHTTYADFLNREPKSDMNDDIFGYFTTPFDCIGILSAGDSAVLIKKMFDLLRHFQPDVIVLAVRTNLIKDVISKIKEEDADFPSDDDCKLLKPADMFLDENGERKAKEIMDENSITSLVEEIKKVIRGF